MRNWLLAGLAALVLIGIVAYARWSSRPVASGDTAAQQSEAVIPPAPSAPVATAEQKMAILPPSFDIVRVEPTGEVAVEIGLGAGESSFGLAHVKFSGCLP